ncbi:uncharacterized protein [Physcomitrium patens]|uniref:SAP domain-containing protein n=2 Tax=Physcomitrium patens TaxID=3218 RepID=A0A2K1LAJ6_PHYPA|nr:dentin sialophosphoprotein-like isoform X1 [Physcomitrium patens]PNR63048.1 hypothetical protein PHYPA_001473 [Physcomitrium patens]|eukprot:XP_024386110.1 dentin sialophosphoprotein-like isoform X1 [Physcomitrella patens]
MEHDNLHEIPRKELKQLCIEHNIRTAGVKHDDIVRLLRNKLYPPAADPPRSTKARGQTSNDSQISSKDKNESAKKTKSTLQGPNKRSLAVGDNILLDGEPERNRKDLSPSPVLPRKPIMTKSNSIPARRSDILLKKLNTGLSGPDKQLQESRPQGTDGSSAKGLDYFGARKRSMKSTRPAVRRLGDRPGVKTSEIPKAHMNGDVFSEAASSPRASEGDASVTAADSSDLGSLSFCSVSEFATDAGHHIMSEDSDVDDGRSVSSEPASRFASQINKLTPRTSTGSKLGRGAHSLWDSENGHGRRHGRNLSLDSSLSNNASKLSAAQDIEDIFSYLLEGTDSLVDDTDILDSFLAETIADPEMFGADGNQVDFHQLLIPDTFAEHYHDNIVVDNERRMGEEAAGTSDSDVAALTTDDLESKLEDSLLADHETARPVTEKPGIVHADVAALPSEPEAKSVMFSTSNDNLTTEISHTVAADDDFGAVCSEGSANSLDYELTIAPDRRSEHVENVLTDVGRGPPIANQLVENNDSKGQHLPTNTSFGEPINVPGAELSHLGEIPSTLEQGKPSIASDDLPDSIDVEESDLESKGLEIGSENRDLEDALDIHKNNEGFGETSTTSRDGSEHTQVAPPALLLLEEAGENDGSGNHEYSEVVVTAAPADSQNASGEDFVAGTLARDSSDSDLRNSVPDQNKSDVKWSSVSALYDDSEYANLLLDSDGYGLPEHKSTEDGEVGNNLAQDIETMKHVIVPEIEALNYAEAAICIERPRTVDEENSRTASPPPLKETYSWNSNSNEIGSKTDEQEELGRIHFNEVTEISHPFEPFPPGTHASDEEVTSAGHEYESIETQSSIFLGLDSTRFTNEFDVSSSVFNVAQNNLEGSIHGEGELLKCDDSFQSSAGDVSCTNSPPCTEGNESRSFSFTKGDLDGPREDDTSTIVNLETSEEELEVCAEQDTCVPTQSTALEDDEEEVDSSTDSKEHESQNPSSQDQDAVFFKVDERPLVKHLSDSASDYLENTHKDTPAPSYPRKMERILTVGLKMLLVIGSLTIGIIKFRNSKFRTS